MTTDELLKIEKIHKEAEERKKKFLKECDWFILVPADKIYRDRELKGQKVYMSFDELKYHLQEFEPHEVKNVKMDCKFVFRTNAWREKLPEFNY